VHWAPEATWAGLHEMLLSGEWHMVHFIGHGDFDTERDEGTLALTGENGRAEWVEADRLVDLLHQAHPIPPMVVLNSCYGAATGTQDLFAGTAAALVRGGVTAVVAMQYAISDTAAAAFARGFYAAIAHGRGVDDAVSSGRVAILGTRIRTLEWVTPVIYLRGHDARLFVLPPRPASDTELERELAGGGPVVPASHHEAFDPRHGIEDGTPQQHLPERPRQATNNPTIVERKVAEAKFLTEAVQWRITEMESLLPDRSHTLSAYRHRIEDIFITEGPDAFVAALQRALATAAYPDGLQSSCRAAYQPDPRELVMEYDLPRPSVVPKVAAYRYAPTKHVMEEQPRPEAEIRERYLRLIASMTLRALAEALDVTPPAVVQDILFNGHVATDVSVTGLARPCLISVRVSRTAFAAIRLDYVDPVACLRYLGAAVSPRAYDLEPVRPVIEFDLSGSSSMDLDLLAVLGRSPDLLAIEPIEFEYLIRRLFEAMGLTSWVTQTARDGGVDGVAVNDDPVLGGLCIIQAKQVGKVLGVEAMRALAGAVEETRAAKGILITTSWVGKAGRDFAARHAWIQIVEGRQLKSLFREHLGLDVRISLPKPDAPQN
jgi:restriction system protein